MDRGIGWEFLPGLRADRGKMLSVSGLECAGAGQAYRQKMSGGKAGEMDRLFYLIGKSASGKDAIYEHLLADQEIGLRALVPWTTRPMREGEQDGVDYHFTDEEGLQALEAAGRVIELREYHTACGLWKYFTADPDSGSERDLDQGNLLGIGTLESFRRLSEYYGKKRVVPLYIEVEDGLRLERALRREMKPGNHRYEEMCRRFLADQRDFSEERLKEAGISVRFPNNGELEECIRAVRLYILKVKNGAEPC